MVKDKQKKSGEIKRGQSKEEGEGDGKEWERETARQKKKARKEGEGCSAMLHLIVQELRSSHRLQPFPSTWPE